MQKFQNKYRIPSARAPWWDYGTAGAYFITSLLTVQSQHTTTHHDFAEIAKTRREFFQKNPDSVAKTLTLVNTYVRAKSGNTSQQYIDVNSLVKKIRGEKPTAVTINSVATTISNTERSYGSQVQNLTNVVSLLDQYGTDYSPTNPSISLSNLQAIKARAISLNNDATIKYAAFLPKITERVNTFKQLNETAIRIKGMVKSQFGNNSTEYNLIKGLAF
jgi:hypothetical protein